MLQSWRSWLVDVIDPHVMVIYAMQDSLAVLVERFRLLGLGDLALGCGSKSPVKVRKSGAPIAYFTQFVFGWEE